MAFVSTFSDHSWTALVRAVDDDFDKESRHPIAYHFGGGDVKKLDKGPDSWIYNPV